LTVLLGTGRDHKKEACSRDKDEDIEKKRTGKNGVRWESNVDQVNEMPYASERTPVGANRAIQAVKTVKAVKQCHKCRKWMNEGSKEYVKGER
jgi:hypothetical protein